MFLYNLVCVGCFFLTFLCNRQHSSIENMNDWRPCVEVITSLAKTNVLFRGCTASLPLQKLPIVNLHLCVLLLQSPTAFTSGWEFLGVNNFCSILLAGGLLDASADNREGSPEAEESEKKDVMSQVFVGLCAWMWAKLAIFQGHASITQKGNWCIFNNV